MIKKSKEINATSKTPKVKSKNCFCKLMENIRNIPWCKILKSLYMWPISLFNKHPRGLINFYDEEKISKKKNLASKIVDNDELDFRKREKMHELLKVLNKVSGETIGISGEQGSGKTTVVKETLLNSFLPKKNFGNSICLAFLYLRLFIVAPFSSKGRNTASSKIAIRRWKYININIWNLFAHVNVADYKDFNNTIFKNKKDEYSTTDRNSSSEKISNIYIKKTLWTSFLVAMKFKTHRKKMEWAIFNNKFSDSTHEEKLLKKWYFSKLFFHILIPVILTTILFVLEWKDKISPFIVDKQYVSSGIASAIAVAASAATYYIDNLYKLKKEETKDSNDFLISPISNELINRIIERKTKRKLLVLHLTEVDRLNFWLKKIGSDSEEDRRSVIYEIVSSYSLSYASKHMKVITEIDKDIEITINTYNNDTYNIGRNSPADSSRKIFNEIIEIQHFNKGLFNRIVEKTYSDRRQLVKDTIINSTDIILKRLVLLVSKDKKLSEEINKLKFTNEYFDESLVINSGMLEKVSSETVSANDKNTANKPAKSDETTKKDVANEELVVLKTTTKTPGRKHTIFKKLITDVNKIMITLEKYAETKKDKKFKHDISFLNNKIEQLQAYENLEYYFILKEDKNLETKLTNVENTLWIAFNSKSLSAKILSWRNYSNIVATINWMIYKDFNEITSKNLKELREFISSEFKIKITEEFENDFVSQKI